MFLVYNPDTMHVYNRYPTERGAKIARARRWPQAAVDSQEDFNAKDELVEVTNLLSGGTATIRKSQQGTFLDPSTERYWSM